MDKEQDCVVGGGGNGNTKSSTVGFFQKIFSTYCNMI
jgi:hypothetical protein